VYLNGNDLYDEGGVYVASLADARAAGARQAPARAAIAACAQEAVARCAAGAICDAEEADARAERDRAVCDAARSRIAARSLGAANTAGTRCAAAFGIAGVLRTALIAEHTAAAFTGDEHALDPIDVSAHVTLASSIEPETEGDNTLASLGEYDLDAVTAERMALLTYETTAVERAGPDAVASATAEPAVTTNALALGVHTTLPVLAIAGCLATAADALVLNVSTTAPVLATAVIGPVPSIPQGEAAAGRSCHRAPPPQGTAAAGRCRRRTRLPQDAVATGRYRRRLQSMRGAVTAERGHRKAQPPQGAVTVGRSRRRKRSVQEHVV
jgi:hypothetical protein